MISIHAQRPRKGARGRKSRDVISVRCFFWLLFFAPKKSNTTNLANYLYAAHVRHKRFRYDNRAVFLLIVFQNCGNRTANSQTGTKNNTKIWQNKADWDWNNAITRTDSVLILKNGVLTTDAASEVQNYAKDKYTILNDESQARKEAFDQFGEADKGGKYVFQYISDTCHNGSNAYSPNYRRNLFVRGLPIEDTTSYRLTFYVKATKVKSGALPRMYADVMRGYFHAEKPFSMGLEDDANNMKYKTTYSYEKRGWGEPTSDDPDPFTGEWEKVTFMTYYTNDSIANSFVFIDDNPHERAQMKSHLPAVTVPYSPTSSLFVCHSAQMILSSRLITSL